MEPFSFNSAGFVNLLASQSSPLIDVDKEKIEKIMRTCVILHNMIVENERHGYTQIDTSEFESGESSRSSKV